jgi:hypothetical protein
MILDKRGVLHTPLALMTALAVVTGLSLWMLLHHWKNLTLIQLRLDHCTGEIALDLKSKIHDVSQANEKIKELRLAEVAAAAVDAQAATAVRTLISLQALRQEEIREEWSAKQISWTVTSGCGDPRDRASPLPALQWIREPEDSLGQKPLHLEQLPPSFHFEIKHSPRASASELTRGVQSESSPSSSQAWHARWSAPNGLLRPSFY